MVECCVVLLVSIRLFTEFALNATIVRFVLLVVLAVCNGMLLLQLVDSDDGRSDASRNE